MISDFKASGLDSDALVSDGQSVDQNRWMLAAGTGFLPVDVGDERSSNLSLTDVRSPAQLLENQTDYEVLARVRSTGSVFLDRGNLSLNLRSQAGDDVVTNNAGNIPVQLNERSEAVINLPLNLDATGAFTGELVLSGDDVDLDNRWYFSLDVLPRMRVLVVNGDPSTDWYDDEAHWFVLALQGLENSPFDVTPVTADALTVPQIREHDAVVLLNTSLQDNRLLAELQNFVTEGGALLLAPGNRVTASEFNDSFADITPATLVSSEELATNDYQLIADVDRRHPALRALDVDFGARFQGYWLTAPVPESDVLMRFDNGSPMLVESQSGEGRSMLLSSSMDLAWSNFPLQGLYLPFVHEVLTYLIQPPQRERAYLVGDMIDLSSFLSADNNTLEFREPDGTLVQLTQDNPFYRARMPGFVQLEETTLAINVAAEAASLRRADIAALTDAVINPETTPMVSEQVRTAQLIADIEQPQRLWWWIVLLVMLLLIVEAWVANRTFR
jgi:hypothetical protein